MNILALDTSSFLDYSIFDSPDIIELNGNQYQIWSEANYLDSEKIVIENWGKWLSTSEEDYFLRFIISENETTRKWDSGFLTGIFEVLYDNENQKILILQKSDFIFEDETLTKTWSYILDIQARKLYRFYHNRNAISGGFKTDGSIWVEINKYNNNTNQYELSYELITKEQISLFAE